MISDEVKSQVNDRFKALDKEVIIEYHEDASAQLNEQIKQLLTELVSISPKLKLVINGDAPLRPSFDLKGLNKGVVRFAGIPSGHEFTTLIESIIMVSTGKHQLSDSTVKFLEGLTKPLDFKVFITTMCPHCPAAVYLAHEMAMVSSKVTATMVESMEFQDLSMRFNISSVPNTIINDSEGFVGAYPENMAVEVVKKKIA